MSKIKEAMEDMRRLGIPLTNEGLKQYVNSKEFKDDKSSNGTNKGSKKKRQNA